MHTLVQWIRAGVRSLLGTSRREPTAAERSRSDGDDSERSAPSAGETGGALVELSDAEFLVERRIARSDHLLETLRQNGGRLSQSEVSEFVGWSTATTSRRLEDLEEEGVVQRYRVGQSNVVFLPDAVPDHVRAESDD